MNEKKVNLKLTKKQAKVVRYWLGFAIDSTRENYEISKERCKDDLKNEMLKPYIETQRACEDKTDNSEDDEVLRQIKRPTRRTRCLGCNYANLQTIFS